MRVVQTAVWSFHLDEAGQGARDTRVRCAVRVVENGLACNGRGAVAGVASGHAVKLECVSSLGRVKRNVAPRPGLAAAHKRPPCDSTMERLIDNPIPLPSGLVV